MLNIWWEIGRLKEGSAARGESPNFGNLTGMMFKRGILRGSLAKEYKRVRGRGSEQGRVSKQNTTLHVGPLGRRQQSNCYLRVFLKGAMSDRYLQ